MMRIAICLATMVILAAAGPATRPAKERVVIAGETFRLEPAVNAKTRQRGLGVKMSRCYASTALSGVAFMRSVAKSWVDAGLAKKCWLPA